MFYCETCRVRKDWPESIGKSRGKCEMCGEGAVCNDVPSSSLPMSPEEQAAYDAMMNPPTTNVAEEFIVREQEVAVSLIVDLIARMEKAYQTLMDEADEAKSANPTHDPDLTERQKRLVAKATGVSLCLSYAREALRP